MFKLIRFHNYTWQRLTISLFLVSLAFYLFQAFNGILSSIIFLILTMIAFAVQYDKQTVKRMFPKLKSSYEIQVFNQKKNISAVTLILLMVLIGYTFMSFLSMILDILSVKQTNHAGLADINKIIWSLPYKWVGLIGEELLKYCVFFPLAHYLNKKYKLIIAFILSAFITETLFGLLHFNMYEWNVVQMIVVVGWSSLVWYYALYKTESIRSTIWIHILYDYIIYIIAILESISI